MPFFLLLTFILKGEFVCLSQQICNEIFVFVVTGVDDPMQHGRGVALADFNRDGKTDIVYGNWNGPHRLFLQLSNNRKQRFKVQILKF